MFFEQSDKLFYESFQKIEVDPNHPWIIAAQKIDWQKLFLELEAILYKNVQKGIGKHLDIRAHCGVYLLQAMQHWTDRESEDMMRYHAPTRIFCGYDGGTTKWLDHTRIEKFRNRLGPDGAEIMNKYILLLARDNGFTNGKDVDMDTTVQEAGIAYPTEMNLMKKIRERTIKIVSTIKGKTSGIVKELKSLGEKAKKVMKEYQFFAKENKNELIEKALGISRKYLSALEEAVKCGMGKLRPKLRKEMEHLLEIVPTLFGQITKWLKTGKVAADKIICLYKEKPAFISKGKIGKAVEVGRKWIINQLWGGFILLTAPENPKIADTDCVKISLQECARTFGEIPESYGTDRGMYSAANIKRCKKYGVKNIGIQPKGQAKWEVGRATAREMYCRRAGIEPRIGILGRLGLKKSSARTDKGDVITGQKAAIGFNLKKLMLCWTM